MRREIRKRKSSDATLGKVKKKIRTDKIKKKQKTGQKKRSEKQSRTVQGTKT